MSSHALGEGLRIKRCVACAAGLPAGSKFCYACGVSTTAATLRCADSDDDSNGKDDGCGWSVTVMHDDDNDDDDGGDDDDKEHEEQDDGTEVNDDAPPSWFRRQRQPGILGRTTSHYHSNAVEVRSSSHAIQPLVIKTNRLVVCTAAVAPGTALRPG